MSDSNTKAKYIIILCSIFQLGILSTIYTSRRMYGDNNMGDYTDNLTTSMQRQPNRRCWRQIYHCLVKCSHHRKWSIGNKRNEIRKETVHEGEGLTMNVERDYTEKIL
ncbi:hypothetical protein SCHPADRAFT_529988 [Schizopora paradoxa]|uniref:Transmembrane protein n=1 Tax=Schizopora paradoxa TaxID=27342 RepID=A0A0H2REF4_9AGAM|nr:hypothetical protein SCHPADRAFT_529988 [Schizopora paradoxa]